MNLDRYEKIDGRDALRKIADKVMIYDHEGFGYFCDSNGIFYRRHNEEHKLDRFPIAVETVCNQDWYIPKPFDVRQAMLDRPNEWVGAFEDRKGEWHKVGFDTESFMAIETSYDSTVKCEFYAYNVRQATEKEMYACIPIEDVPEEATR